MKRDVFTFEDINNKVVNIMQITKKKEPLIYLLFYLLFFLLFSSSSYLHKTVAQASIFRIHFEIIPNSANKIHPLRPWIRTGTNELNPGWIDGSNKTLIDGCKEECS